MSSCSHLSPSYTILACNKGAVTRSSTLLVHNKCVQNGCINDVKGHLVMVRASDL